MGRTPVLKSREVISILAALGFAEVRQRGSHKQFRHLTAGAQPSQSIKGEMSLQFWSVKLRRTSG
jgi:predicted RNA binding protein YcfA (HicA-like mRNA interferase family)